MTSQQVTWLNLLIKNKSSKSYRVKSTNYNWFKEEKWIALDHIGSIYFYDYDNPKEALKYYIPSAEILEELNNRESQFNFKKIYTDLIENLKKWK